MTPAEIEADAKSKLAAALKAYSKMVEEALFKHLRVSRKACDIALMSARVWHVEQWLNIESEYHRRMCDSLMERHN